MHTSDFHAAHRDSNPVLHRNPVVPATVADASLRLPLGTALRIPLSAYLRVISTALFPLLLARVIGIVLIIIGWLLLINVAGLISGLVPLPIIILLVIIAWFTMLRRCYRCGSTKHADGQSSTGSSINCHGGERRGAPGGGAPAPLSTNSDPVLSAVEAGLNGAACAEGAVATDDIRSAAAPMTAERVMMDGVIVYSPCERLFRPHQM